MTPTQPKTGQPAPTPAAKTSPVRLIVIALGTALVMGVLLKLIITNFEQLDYTTRSDTPLTAPQVADLLAFVLPSGASNVYFLHHRTGIHGLDFYLRFQMPPAAAASTVAYLLANHPHQTNTTQVQIPGADLKFVPLAWWNVPAIKHGFAILAPGQYSRSIWYDADASVFYVHEKD